MPFSCPPMPSPSLTHKPVLLPQTVAALLGVSVGGLDTHTKKYSGVFVDATFGRGGHSRYLLQFLAKDATLLVFDKDPDAIKEANILAKDDERVVVIHASFAKLSDALARLNIGAVDGIMADLGVSSPQLDDGERGFSFNKSGLVDMRMDTSRGQSVGEWLSEVDEGVLADVLYEYGEERHSRRIARAIKAMPHYNDTLLLAQTIKDAHPNWQKGKHPATKSFQAMRIFINNELSDLEAFLWQALVALSTGGSLALISFHSLEDRKIKQFLNNHSRGSWLGDDKLPLPPIRQKYFEKPKRIAPSDDEIGDNQRARSAYLRYAKRTCEVAL